MIDFKTEYTQANLPGSFSGQSVFFKELFKRYPNKKIDKKEIQNWLLDQDTYTIHKYNKKKFKRNKIIVNGIDDTWQADLVDLSNLSEVNDDYKWLLTVIDVFSKFAWAIPLKNKQSNSVVEGFQKILQSGRYPNKLQTDQGNEFLNKNLKKLLKNVNMYVLNSEMKASVIERFNRTLKEKMWRYFTFKQSHRYIDILQDIVYSYNHTFHRTIKTSPNEVNKINEELIFKNIYGYSKDLGDSTVVKNKFKVGDKVRISKYKNIFEKSYTPNWTREIFIVDKILPRVPTVYILKDQNNEIIQGIFYEQQMENFFKNDDIYYVEKIIKSRKNKKGIKEYFIKWLGYPDKFNSWEPLKNIIELNDQIIDENKLHLSDEQKNKRLIFSV